MFSKLFRTILTAHFLRYISFLGVGGGGEPMFPKVFCQIFPQEQFFEQPYTLRGMADSCSGIVTKRC